MTKAKSPQKTSKKPMGRPSDYREGYAEQAYKLCLLGAIVADLANFFGVSTVTIDAWKKKHPEFLSALKRGKDDADAKVAESLYKRATGYSHPDVHITVYQGDVTETPITKYYPPDPTSCIFWLKNRQRRKWRDVHQRELSGPGGGPIETQNNNIDLSGITDEDLKVAEKLGLKIIRNKGQGESSG